MRPAARRSLRRATAARPGRAGRGGFTLIEMLVSVTLVLMMMLMFAEIYSLAQQTMSTQKGIAENDQKARILAEVIHHDLDTRTFRSVYPFKLEENDDLGPPTTVLPVVNYPPGPDQRSQLLALRRGYFSYSENDPDNDGDDVLQLTVDVSQPGYGGAGDRLYGKASKWPTSPAPPATLEQNQDEPEYDDGIAGNSSGMSGSAEISYFLRNGNLYRSVLLVRDPYSVPTSPTGQPTLDPTYAPPANNPTYNYGTFSAGYPLPGVPAGQRTVWNDFDYSAFRYFQPTPSPVYRWKFHSPSSLSNDPTANVSKPFRQLTGRFIHTQESLGAPYHRYGFTFSDVGAPLEYAGSQFFGRFTVPERSSVLFDYPGKGWGVFDTASGATPPADADGDGLYDFNGAGAALNRPGVDLLLSNVHSFDIEVWDDVLGKYVDLGYDDPDGTADMGVNPYTGNTEVGFYHSSRLRRAFVKPTLVAGESYYYDFTVYNGRDFGNRYDTWHPRMFISNFVPNAQRWRTGRAPYRPQMTNPDPNDSRFNAPPALPVDATVPSLTRESRMTFGDDTIDDDHDGTTVAAGDVDDTDGEAPLRAIRIQVRFLDATSGQVRQETIEASLID